MLRSGLVELEDLIPIANCIQSSGANIKCLKILILEVILVTLF